MSGAGLPVQSADAAGLLPVCSPLPLRQDGGELHKLHSPCGHCHHQVSPPDPALTEAQFSISGPSPPTLSTLQQGQATPPGPGLWPRPPLDPRLATPPCTTPRPPRTIQTILSWSGPVTSHKTISTIITEADNSRHPLGREVTSPRPRGRPRDLICPRSGQSASTGSGRRRSWLNITS